MAAAPDADPRRDLVRRVAGSTAFQRTWRLRELLLFLCDRVLTDPERPPREAEIGAAVFGRGEGFDPGVDPLVRVQTSQLRKRLRLYFATEGAAETMIIEIPKGAYAPAFRDRATVPPPAEDEDDEDPRRSSDRLLLAVVAVLAVACAALLLDDQRLRRATRSAPSPTPHLAHLWSALVGPGRTTHVVLADGSLSVFLDTTGRVLSAASYQRGEFDTRYMPGGAAWPAVPDPPDVTFARRLLSVPLTSPVDAALAHHVGVMSGALGGTSRVLFAREATPDLFRSGSVVVCGPRRSNPWSELFDERMNFQALLNKGVGVFRNASPRAGEDAEYRAVPEQVGYCRVALIEGLDGRGRVLLVTGTDLTATRSGVELVTDEAAVASLSRVLAADAGASFPRFEALLRVRYLANTPVQYERIAHRAVP
jgi:hypothetical protein